jgi:hypothetical protein
MLSVGASCFMEPSYDTTRRSLRQSVVNSYERPCKTTHRRAALPAQAPIGPRPGGECALI